jgi:imidazolonepropionase-like amidohydrolase
MSILRILLAIMLVGWLAGEALAQIAGTTPDVRAVRFGRLWDANGKYWSNAIVVIEGERIKTVTEDAAKIPAGAKLIDLSKYTGLPGLIDVHTHMTFYAEPTPGEPQQKQISGPTATPAAVEVFLARKGALRTFESGVTTVRDLGSDQYMDIAMRDLINRGEMVGPRMFVAGYGIYITMTPFKKENALRAGGLADGVPQVLRAVREQIAAGVDVIKMYASTGSDDDVTGFQLVVLFLMVIFPGLVTIPAKWFAG